jgi:hypothetical protein
MRAPESTRLCVAVAILGGAAYGLRLAVYSGLSAALLAIDRILIVLGQVLLETTLVWLLAVWLMRRGARWGEVFRPVALARAPQVLYALLALLEAPSEASVIVSIWLLVCFTVAVRTALASGWVAAAAVVLAMGLAVQLLDRSAPLLPT